MADTGAQRLGRLGGHARAMVLSPAERQESARNAAVARWQGDVEMSGKPLITYDQWRKLGPERLAEILDYIKKAVPGRSGLNLSVAQYRIWVAN
jgi:hypothetical protein